MRTALLQVFAAKDTAKQILSLLPLSALGALLCTCSSLRTLLVETPSVWQAAAAREHPFHHPLHRCMEPLSYLQRQQRVHANIAAGYTEIFGQHLYGHQKAVLSPDGCKHARLDAAGRLRVHSTMAGGKLLHTWPLPVKTFQPAANWDWNLTSSAVLLPFGLAWGPISGVSLAPVPQPADFQGSGFMLVEANTGTSVIVMLPSAEHLPARGWQYLRKPIPVVQCVLVPHSVGQDVSVWVYSTDGRHLSSTSLPEGCCLPLSRCWAPGGNIAYLSYSCSDRIPHQEGYSRCEEPAFMWHPAAGSCVPITQGSWPHCRPYWAAWAPSGTMLLLGCEHSTVLFISSLGAALCAPQQIEFDSDTAAWACCGVVLAGHDSMRLYSVQGFSLVLCHTVMLPCISLLAFSPDAMHVVAQSTSATAIVNAVTGAVHMVAEPSWSTWSHLRHRALAWPLPALIVKIVWEDVRPGDRNIVSDVIEYTQLDEHVT